MKGSCCARCCAWTILGWLAWSVSTASGRAAIIFEDHFLSGANPSAGEYQNNVTLAAATAQNPTITNANGDYVNSTGQSGNVSARSVSTGLSFGPNFPVSGGSIESFRIGSNNSSDDAVSVRRPAANNTSTTLLGSEAFYFSALLQYVPGHRVGFGLDFESSSTTNNFGIGFDTTGNIGIMGASANTGKDSPVLNPVDNGGSAFTAGTYLVVGKITPVSGGADTISIVLATNNPLAIPSTEPAVLTSNSTLNVWEAGTADTLENFWLYYQKPVTGGGFVNGRIDEFRVTTTYAEAVQATQAVPEPGTLLWSGLAGLAIWKWRRIRHWG
jgi:hypothetical protein